jgi:plasmid stabilization system protein ParE
MRVEFHPATVQDVNEAADYYDRQRPGLASEFRGEVMAALSRITQSPLSFPIVEADIRRCIIRRFPYSILFRVRNPDTIRVLVIRHHKRQPKLGLARR